MAVNYKVWDFPNLKVKSQVFHVPGSALDGGYTVGGARIMSPEPGGRSVLELQLALQVTEWAAPFTSWLMSKINGEIFKVQLTRTPQLVPDADLNINVTSVPWAATGLMPDSPWDNDQLWLGDGANASIAAAGLAGETSLSANMTGFGNILKAGHVIGIYNSSYLIEDIEYVDNIAMMKITPPLRNNVAIGGMLYFRPFFTGVITNGEEFRSTYDASYVGHIEPGRLIMREVII